MGLFGSKAGAGSRPVTVREIRRRMTLQEKSAEAFARGDTARALDLGAEAAEIIRRERADYDRFHPLGARYGTPPDDLA